MRQSSKTAGHCREMGSTCQRCNDLFVNRITNFLKWISTKLLCEYCNGQLQLLKNDRKSRRRGAMPHIKDQPDYPEISCRAEDRSVDQMV